MELIALTVGAWLVTLFTMRVFEKTTEEGSKDDKKISANKVQLNIEIKCPESKGK